MTTTENLERRLKEKKDHTLRKRISPKISRVCKALGERAYNGPHVTTFTFSQREFFLERTRFKRWDNQDLFEDGFTISYQIVSQEGIVYEEENRTLRIYKPGSWEQTLDKYYAIALKQKAKQNKE